MRLAVIVALLLSVTAVPAAAADTSGDYAGSPTIAVPISDAYRANGVTSVQIEGPRNLYGTRTVATWIDQRVAGLRIRTGGTCAQNQAALCVHVNARRFGRTGWWGETFQDDPVRIDLNTTYSGPGLRGTACHEFLHALGMAHHGVRGCITSNAKRYPSAAELEAVKAYYDNR
jgi:hypothetical protein